MSFAGVVDRLDRWQRRSPPIAVVVAVVKKFVDDRCPNLGVQLAYWAFFSVFSLLLAFVAILGFAFHGDPSFQADVRDSVLRQMPVIGPQVSSSVESLTGSGVALAIGIIASLWSGLGVTLALGDALDRVWGVPRFDRPGFVSARLRGLALLALVGTIMVASTVAVGLASGGEIRPLAGQLLSFAVTAAVDVLMFLACFRLLTAAPVTIRSLLPGAAVATTFWFALQAIGGLYVSEVVKGSSQTYGGFAVVVGLLSWLLVGAQATLIAAEVNVVLAWRLWPRALGGRLGEADQRALRAAAEAERSDPRAHITVAFEAPRRTSPDLDDAGKPAST